MSADETSDTTIDDILLPFLNAEDERESQQHLEFLLTLSAEPVLRRIVNRKLHPSMSGEPSRGVEDVCGEARLQLLAKLRELKTNPGQRPIGNFRAYVAVVAYNACHEHIRQKYPRRYRLRNSLRYLLTHDRRFALWEGSGESVCGLAKWRDKTSPLDGGRRLRELRDSASAFEKSVLSRIDLERLDIDELLRTVFETVGYPVELDELVNAISRWKGIREDRAEPDTDDDDGGQGELADTRVAIDIEVEQRMYVARLWAEICQLPQRQRAALLLNLRDVNGGDCIELFPLAGVASPREIAGLLEIPAERFAEMWNDLPLEDALIAAHLGITRQQVINLRKSARERLARRMRAFEEGKLRN